MDNFRQFYSINLVIKLSLKKCIIILLVSLFSHLGFSQQNDGYGVNLPKFYKSPLHFGFTIAGNSTDFRIVTVPNSKFPDTLIVKTARDIR